MVGLYYEGAGRAECIDEYSTWELVAWVNEIHRWGLYEHSPGCEKDIKTVLQIG